AVGVLVALMAVVPAAAAGSPLPARAIAFASIPPVILGDYFTALLTANYRFAVTNASALLTPVLILALNGSLALVGSLSVTTAVAAWVIGQLAGTAVVTLFVLRDDGLGAPSRPLARRMATFGLKTHGG